MKPSDLIQGTIDVLILKSLATEPRHGWAIAKRIQSVSGEVLQVKQGSLYPALHRLEQQGLIRGDRPHRRLLLRGPVTPIVTVNFFDVTGAPFSLGRPFRRSRSARRAGVASGSPHIAQLLEVRRDSFDLPVIDQ